MAKAKDLATDAASFDPIKFASDLGIKSEYAYIGGFVSIIISAIAWFSSRGRTSEKPQGDRWGIFLGHWAPTFFGLGIALKLYEKR